MGLNVGKELATLRRMTVGELRAQYTNLFGEPTAARHKEWLVKRLIWRMQAVAEGDLSERARRRAAELANDADLRRQPPRTPAGASAAAPTARTGRLSSQCDRRVPLPGSVITRVYKGESIEVAVLPAGFEYGGEIYGSLSAVAKKITGSHCNGYHFFRLNKEGGAR
jgi:hypothetical protein